MYVLYVIFELYSQGNKLSVLKFDIKLKCASEKNYISTTFSSSSSYLIGYLKVSSADFFEWICIYGKPLQLHIINLSMCWNWRFCSGYTQQDYTTYWSSCCCYVVVKRVMYSRHEKIHSDSGQSDFVYVGNLLLVVAAVVNTYCVEVALCTTRKYKKYIYKSSKKSCYSK